PRHPASCNPCFFYSHAHHRDLHSFPTRRSSDLRELEREAMLGAQFDDALMSPRRREAHAAPQRDAVHLQALGDDGHGRAIVVLPDRKITRLNSSHDQISYAVFCLKKKKKTTKQQ